jgi:hypothetical protein
MGEFNLLYFKYLSFYLNSISLFGAWQWSLQVFSMASISFQERRYGPPLTL